MTVSRSSSVRRRWLSTATRDNADMGSPCVPDTTTDATRAVGARDDARDGAGDRDAAILTVSELELSFGGVRALAGAELVVQRGSITALIGPNGAGKTTLFNLIAGSLRPNEGTILLDGQAIGAVLRRDDGHGHRAGRDVVPRGKMHGDAEDQ